MTMHVALVDQSTTLHHICNAKKLRITSEALHVQYSAKFLLGANFRDFHGQTCFHKNKNCEKRTKLDKKVMSLCAYAYVDTN